MWKRVLVVTTTIVVSACDGPRAVPTAPTGISGVATPATSGVRGTVADTAFRPVPDAVIEVLDGPQAGRMTRSDAAGQFAFDGTFTDGTRVQATKEHYASAIQPMRPACATCTPTRWVHFALQLLVPSVDMAGEYEVTIAADPRCTNLPADLRRRSYQASIPAAGHGAQALIPLRGATFVPGLDQLSMGIAGDYVAFWLEHVVEQVAPNAYLTVGGTAAAPVAATMGARLAFPLDGVIDFCVTPSEFDAYRECSRTGPSTHVSCSSGQLILQKR